MASLAVQQYFHVMQSWHKLELKCWKVTYCTCMHVMFYVNQITLCSLLFLKVSVIKMEVMSEDWEVVWTRCCNCDIDVSSANMTVITALVLLFLCRVARTWNQTGDKWAHLPDVSDWLVRQVLVCLLFRCLLTAVESCTYLEKLMKHFSK